MRIIKEHKMFKVNLHYAISIFDIDKRHIIDRFDVECRCRMSMSRRGDALSTSSFDIYACALFMLRDSYAMFTNCMSMQITAIRVDLCRPLSVIQKQPNRMRSNA